MKKSLYLSAYDEKLKNEIAGLLRLLGRKVKEPIWGYEFDKIKAPMDILYLDSAGKAYGLSVLANAIKYDLLEVDIYLSEERRYIHIISGKANAIKERIEEVANEKSAISIFSNTFLSLNKEFHENKRYLKENLSFYINEYNESDILSDEYLRNTDIFVVEESILGAILVTLIRMYEKGEPIAIIKGSDCKIYFSVKGRHKSVFINDTSSVKEVVAMLCRWLMDKGEEKASERLMNAHTKLGEGATLKAITEEINRPIRRRNSSCKE